MSTIDNEVVKLEFENSNFESNVSTSLSTLDKLKQALKFDGVAKSIQSVGDQVGKINVDALNASAETVQNRFSALGAVATGALMTIGSTAVTVGGQILKNMTIQPIIDGFHEYEMTMNSVKTIMANLPTETVDHVNSTLAELNKYSDETIYTFSDMTRAIGQFTAAGVDLDSATTAIKGMANVAAGAGANNAALARAEYQVSQALQSGTIRLMDWNSLVQAGMANPELQEQLKQTAREQGVAVDSMIDKAGSFRDSLSQGWLTADIFVKTMAKAADKSTEWGARLTEAATQVNTATQLGSVIMESIGSSWTNTWQLILGDYAQSKKFFTSLYNEINPLIDAVGNFRNEALKTWADLGGRDALFSGITDSIQGCINLLTLFGENISKLFGGSGSVLADISKGFANGAASFKAWTENLGSATGQFDKDMTGSQRSARDFGDAIRGVFSGIDILRNALEVVGTVAKRAFDIIGKLAGSGAKIVLAIVGGVGRVVSAFDDLLNQLGVFSGAKDAINKFFDSLNDPLTLVGKLADAAANGISTFFDHIVDWIGKAAGPIGSFTEHLKGAGEVVREWLGVLKDIGGTAFRAVEDAFSKAAGAVGKFVSGIDFSPVSSALFILADGAKKAADAFGHFAGDAFDKIKSALSGVMPALSEFGGFIKSNLPGAIEALVDWLKSAADSIKSFAKRIGDALSDIFPNALKNIQNGIHGVVDTFANLVKPIKAYAQTIDDNGEAVVQSSKKYNTASDNIKDALSKMKDAFKKAGEVTGITDLSKSIANGFHNSGFSGIKDGIINYFKNVNIADIIRNCFNTYIIPAFSKIGEWIGDLGRSVKDHAPQIISTAKDVLSAIADGIAGAFDAFVKSINPNITNAGDFIKDAVSNFSDILKDVFGKLSDAVKNILKALHGSLDNFNGADTNSVIQAIETAFGVGAAYNLSGSLKNTSGVWYKVAEIGKSLADAVKKFADGIDNIGKGIKWAAIAATIISVATAVSKISEAIVSLGKMDTGQLIQGVIAVAAIVGAVAAIVAILEKYNGYKTKIETAVKNVSGQANDPISKIKGFITSVQSSLSSIGQGIKLGSIAASIAAVAGMIALLSIAVQKLGQMDTGQLTQGLVSIGVIVGLAATVMRTAAKMAEGAGNGANTVLKLAIAVGVVAGAFVIVSKQLQVNDLGTTIAALGILIGALGALTTVDLVLSNFAGGSDGVKGATAVLLLSGSLLLISKALKKITSVYSAAGVDTTNQALTAVIALLGVLTLVDLALSNFTMGSASIKSATAVVMLAYAVNLMCQGVAAIPNPTKSIPVIEAVQTLLIAIGGVIGILGNLDATGALQAGAGVSLVIGTMAALVFAIGTIPDPSNAMTILTGMSGVAIVLGVVLGALSAVGPGALAAGAAMALVGLAFMEMAQAMAIGADALEVTVDALDKLSDVIAKMGELDQSSIDNFSTILNKLSVLNLTSALSGITGGGEAVAATIEALTDLASVLDIWNSGDYTQAVSNISLVCDTVGGSMSSMTTILAGITGAGGSLASAISAISDLGNTIQVWNNGDYTQAASNIQNVCTAISGSLMGFTLDAVAAATLGMVAAPLMALAPAVQMFEGIDPSVGSTIGYIISNIATSIMYLGQDLIGLPILAVLPSPLMGLAQAVQTFDGIDSSVGSTIGYIIANLATNMGYLGNPTVLLGLPILMALPGPLMGLVPALQAFAGMDTSVGDTIGYILANLATNMGYLVGAALGLPILMALPGPLSALASACQAFAGVDLNGVAGGITALSTALAGFAPNGIILAVAAAGMTALAGACALLAGPAYAAAGGLMALLAACSAAGSAFAALASAGARAFGSLVSLVAGAASAIGAAIFGAASQVGSALSSMVSAVLSGGARMAAAAAQAAMSTARNFVSGIAGAVGAVAGAAASVANAARNGLVSGLSNMFSVGRNFVMGFVNGIRSAISSAVSAAASLAKSAADAVKHFLNINSPSKLMHWMGQMFDYGMKNGITDFTSDVAKAAARMSDATADAVSTPTITPVLDDSNISQALSLRGTTLTLSPDATTLNSLLPDTSNDDVVAAINSLRNDISEYEKHLEERDSGDVILNNAVLNGNDDIRSEFISLMYELKRRGEMMNGSNS